VVRNNCQLDGIAAGNAVVKLDVPENLNVEGREKRREKAARMKH